MFKKKQARFSVSIPYEQRENKLWIQPIIWPDQCPCCNEKDDTALGTYKFQWSVSNPQISKFSPSSYFPLEWEVPYCLKCQKHMRDNGNWSAGILVICLFVPLIVFLFLDVSSVSSIFPLMLMWFLFTVVGWFVLYKIIIKPAIVKSPCDDLAFGATALPTEEHRIIFTFDSEEYAELFSTLNMAELKNN